MEIGYDAGDRGEPEYPEHPAEHECEWRIKQFGRHGTIVECECGVEMSSKQAEAILNEHAKLKRVRDAAKNQRDMLRKTKHFGDLTEIERELFDALTDTQEQLTKDR